MNNRLILIGLISVIGAGWIAPSFASDYLSECKALKGVAKKGKDPCFFIELNDGLLTQFQPPQPPAQLEKKRKTFSVKSDAAGGETNTLELDQGGSNQVPFGGTWGGGSSGGQSGGTW